MGTEYTTESFRGIQSGWHVPSLSLQALGFPLPKSIEAISDFDVSYKPVDVSYEPFDVSYIPVDVPVNLLMCL